MSPTIVITGAGAGIGAEAARQLAREGWTICATDINPTALDTASLRTTDARKPVIFHASVTVLLTPGT